MTARLIVAPSAEAAASLAARRVVNALRSKPDLVLGLAAGQTFEPVYKALSEAQPDLSRATAVQLDEYEGLTADNPGAFRSFLTRSLFNLLQRPPRALLIDGATADAEREISRHASAVRYAGGIDLQLLGLGLNGHLAFNEPGTPSDRAAAVVDLASDTRAAAEAAGLDPAPTRGLTLGLADILAARSVLLVVLGSHKADVLRRTFEAPTSADLPASHLTNHPDVTIVADMAAAARLDRVLETTDV